MNALGAVGYVVGLIFLAFLLIFGVPFSLWLFFGAGQ